MTAFHSAREAKEFLVSRIVAEAQRENVLLSETERKMLYFSESEWTLPDITAVSEEFDRDYDQDEYEKKIAGLVRKADKDARKESRDEYDSWWNAIRFLKRQDHYLSVMIGLAGLRPAGDHLKLLAAGLAIVACLLLAEFLSIHYKIEPSLYLPSGSLLIFYTCAIAVGLAIGYLLFRFIVGGKRADYLTSKTLDKIVRLYQRTR